MPRPWNIITTQAVVGVSGVFDLVEGNLCAMFRMEVGAGKWWRYRRIRGTRVWREVVWQVHGDMIRLGSVIGRGKKVVMTAISGHGERTLVLGWFTLDELMKSMAL